jgi:hypothetical protein
MIVFSFTMMYGRVLQTDDATKQTRDARIGFPGFLVPRARIELATPRFSGACSTD